jgi:flagellar hook-length control protein FliK
VTPADAGLLSQPPQLSQAASNAADGGETRPLTDSAASASVAPAISQAEPSVLAALASSSPIAAAVPALPARAPGTVSTPEQSVSGDDASPTTAPANGIPMFPGFAAVAAARLAAPTSGLPQSNQDGPAQSDHDAGSSGSSSDVTPDLALLGTGLITDQATVQPPVAAARDSQAVQTPVGASGWAEEVGNHVVLMAHQGVTSASLRLQPEHLGPLEVKIALHDTSASVWFGASEPQTRSALQASLPQLREMFAAQGMTLTDAGVSREPPRDTQSLARASAQPSGATAATAPEALPVTVARRGLIDTYA